MNMVEKEKDLISFAHKVITFATNIIECCKINRIDAPSHEQISAYINDYGFHFEDFMTDYIEHEGMFRRLMTPLEKFKKKLDEITFSTKPTDEEIAAFFKVHGDNVSLFCEKMIIKNMNPIERKTLLATIDRLSEDRLVKLWNTFIEESGIYGGDSIIFDLLDKDDCETLGKHMNGSQVNVIHDMKGNGTRFVQWFFLNDFSIVEKKNIKGIIIAYWREIFERIMLYPSAYTQGTYFDEVFFRVLAKEVGYVIDGDKGTITEIEK